VLLENQALKCMSLKANTGFQVTLLLNSSHPLILGTDYLISKRIVLDFGDLSVQTNCNVKSQKPFSVAPNTEV
jgi:hypothetical protein